MGKSSYTELIAKHIFSFVIALAIFFGIFYLFAGKLFFSQKSTEYARRIVCQQNLIEISSAIKFAGLHLEEDNIRMIEDRITLLDLKCSSGIVVHTDKTQALYGVFRLPDGHIVISENAKNHDPNIIKHIDCRYVRYCLYERHNDNNQIELGLWRDPNMVFDKIQPVTNDLE